jgi:membrane protein implicated in regulation of membrane protease activity
MIEIAGGTIVAFLFVVLLLVLLGWIALAFADLLPLALASVPTAAVAVFAGVLAVIVVLYVLYQRRQSKRDKAARARFMSGRARPMRPWNDNRGEDFD